MKRLSFKKIGLFIGFICVLVGCSPSIDAMPSQTQSTTVAPVVQTSSATNYGELLANAQSIRVSKAFISFNPKYKITIDGRSFGTVQGKYINVTGDVFKLIDENGTLWGQEKQIKRWGIKWNRLAEVMNPNGQTVGFIGEQVVRDFFKYGYSFHFYDANKNEIGHSDEVFFSLTKEYHIKDNQNRLLYTIKGNFFSLTNTYDIEVIDSSVVPVEQAIFLTCILDAIATSEKEESEK